VDSDRRAAERLPPLHEIAFWLAGYDAEQTFRPPGRKRAAAVDVGEVQKVLRETKTRLMGASPPQERPRARGRGSASTRRGGEGISRVKGPFLSDGEAE